jgi:hypothetical protein
VNVVAVEDGERTSHAIGGMLRRWLRSVGEAEKECNC